MSFEKAAAAAGARAASIVSFTTAAYMLVSLHAKEHATRLHVVTACCTRAGRGNSHMHQAIPIVSTAEVSAQPVDHADSVPEPMMVIRGLEDYGCFPHPNHRQGADDARCVARAAAGRRRSRRAVSVPRAHPAARRHAAARLDRPDH